MLKVPHFVKNYTIGCANSQKNILLGALITKKIILLGTLFLYTRVYTVKDY